ncbi:hypothetical protein NKR19_g1424 [Coniochaeta hoffmannii]|uniref:Uncharacterized protein n=1 Tax=Coniochaeta hoffmannii TaxID=91930 RepID=A0AA38VT40_9PEZI|nr:hypothetical protein NKR19_g1424 [Coniochaeta hoffmannii]
MILRWGERGPDPAIKLWLGLLGSLTAGSRVNLERAVRADTTRMGKHLVQGHVDTVAAVTAVTPDGNAVTARLAPRDRRHAEARGVDDYQGWWWEVHAHRLRYTQERVVIAGKKAGETVNVEVDT